MTMTRERRLTDDAFGYANLCQHAATCVLTKADRRALIDHIQRADKVGTGVFEILARLLGMKLLYATILDDGRIDPKAATGGARVTYAIDDAAPQTGRLFHYDEFAEEDIGIHVGSLLGATLIGMKVDTRVPFLQADGTFRRMHLLGVERPQA